MPRPSSCSGTPVCTSRSERRTRTYSSTATWPSSSTSNRLASRFRTTWCAGSDTPSGYRGVGSLRRAGYLQLLSHPDLVRVREAVGLGDAHVAGPAGAAVVAERDVRERVPGLDRVDDVAVLVGVVELRGVLHDLQAGVVHLRDAGHVRDHLPYELQLRVRAHGA